MARGLMGAVLALGLLGVPAVLAATSGPHHVPARSSAGARAAALPRCTIIGTAGRDVVRGTPGDDVICAVAGNDRVYGGRGDDVIFGSTGDDDLYGGPGDDRLYGFRGRDHLHGGPGRDFLQGALGPDVISGGPGVDIADYRLRHHSVHVTLGHGADDGAAGERDDVRADVERVRGGHKGDVLIGDGKANRLYGAGGGDKLRGGKGDDGLWGGRGDDRLDARDGTHYTDSLHCGPGGGDTALTDAPDHAAKSCERIRRTQAPAQPQTPSVPKGMSLSDSSVTENRPPDTTVGTLSVKDAGHGHHYRFRLVSGRGDSGNGAFATSGVALVTAAFLDYETQASYSIRVRATDERHPGRSLERVFTISVKDADDAPTAIALAPAHVAENQPVGTTVGALSATDQDAADTHAFTLVSGAGDADNGSFAVAGSALRTAAVFDYETKPSYSVRVRATDSGGESVEQAFTIAVTDTAEVPTAAGRSVTGVQEDGASKTIQLSGADSDGGALTFSVADPAHGSVDTTNPAATCTSARPNACTATVDYTPDPDFNGTDTFTYRVASGSRQSAPATVTVAVDPVNDAPTADDGTLTLDEDTSAPVDLGALAADTETADDDLTYEIVTDGAHGHVTPNGATPTYTPDADFNGTDSFTYKVTDRGDPDECSAAPCDAPLESTTATVTITVNPVNDAPTALPGDLSVDEDTPGPIDLAALASDRETAAADLTYAVASGPTHGTLTGSGASRTYTPDVDYAGPDSFTYKVTDRGDPDGCSAAPCDATQSATATVTIDVAAVDDAPVNTVPAGPVTAVPGTDTSITGLSVADIDAATDDVELTLSVTNGTLTVDSALLPNVTGNGSSEVVITDDLDAINTVLHEADGVVYHPASAGPDTLTVKTDDLGHTGLGGPLTDTDTLAIVVDFPPVAASQTATTDEDTPTTITLDATDEDGDVLAFATGNPAHGALGAIGPASCIGPAPSRCAASVTYTPAPDYNGGDSFTYTATDGKTDSNPATVTITVNPVDDAPQIAGVESSVLAYTENDPATQVTATALVSDVDSNEFSGGSLIAAYGTGGSVDDRLAIRDEGTGDGQIGVSGSTVSYSGAPIGTVTGGDGLNPLVVSFTSPDATPAAVQALVRAVTYRNVSDDPSMAARSVRFLLDDGDGASSAPAERDVALTAVDDPPSIGGIESTALAYTENDPATAITSALTVSDPDSDVTGAQVAITDNLATAEDTLSFVNQPGITGSYDSGTGILTLTGAASPAEYQTALRAVKYVNTSEDPSTQPRTVTFTVDGAGTPATRDITVTAVNDAPVAGGDSFNANASALANTTMTVGTSASEPHTAVTGNLLDNDTDVDSPKAGFTITPAASAPTTRGGTVAIGNDGTFTYKPPPGITTNGGSSPDDTFTYTLHDNDAPDRTATGTVTVRIVGPTAWYVDDDAPAGGNGTSSAPFKTLAPLDAGGSSDSLDGTGDRIFVYGGTYTSGIALEGSQQLLGQPHGLSFTDTAGRSQSPVAPGGTRPALSSSSGPVVKLASGNDLENLALGTAGAGTASLSGTSVGTATAGATSIDNTAGKAIDIDTGTLAMTLPSVSSASSPTEGIRLVNARGTLTIGGGSVTNATNADVAISGGDADVSDAGSISDTSGTAVSVGSTTGGTKSFSGSITGGDVSLSSNGGATMSFSGDLSLDTFAATGGGTVSATGAANTLSTTNATALNVSSTNIGASDLTFRSISATGGSNGIVLNSTGSAGNLVVTGNGGTCTAASPGGCTGGTIASLTGGDDASATPAGTGIVLKDTSAPSLTRMWIHDTSNYGIRGTNVAGLTLANSVVNGTNGNNGTDPFNDSSVRFDNLTGSASVTNTAVSGGFEDNFAVHNTTGTLNRLTFDGVTIGRNSTSGGNDGIGLGSSGSTGAFNATIANSTLTGSRGDLVDYDNGGSGTGDLVLANNHFSNDEPGIATGGGGLTLSSEGTAGTTSMSITGNTFRDAVGAGILVLKTPGSSTQTGTFSGNTIGVSGLANSGSAEGDALKLQTAGGGTMTWAVTNNQIFGYNNFGIEVEAGGGATPQSGAINTTITGNTIAQPGNTTGTQTLPKNGLHLNIGTVPGDTYQACAVIGGAGALANQLASSGLDGVPATGLGDVDVRLRQRQSTTIRLPGYAGSPTDVTAVQSFVAANNPVGTPNVLAGASSPPGGGFTGGGTSCP